jgi:GTP-binding protein HflX
LLSDTVGFIRKLPHQLVEAFKATLEELSYADVLLHVIDLSSPDWEEQAAVVDSLIVQLGAEQTPCIRVFNKCDAFFGELPHERESVCISARTGEGTNELLDAIRDKLNDGKLRVSLMLPYANAGIVELLHREAAVLSTEYGDEGIAVEAIVKPELMGKLEQFRR